MKPITIPALTAKGHAAMLLLHSQKTSAGISSPVTTGQKAAIPAVFYCPSKTLSTALIRLKFFMVGCIGQPQGWPVPVAGTANPIQSASQRLAAMRGGYILTTGEAAMRHHATNPSKKTDIKPQIQYTQHGHTRRMTTTGLSVEQALKLWNACKVVGGVA